MIVEKNIRYCNTTEYDQALNTLDIYFLTQHPGQLKKPIVVFIHGGGWSYGDKSLDDEISFPTWFVDHGYVFVSVNYRLARHPRSPQATIYDMAKDIGKAIKWLTVNGRRYGGKNEGFVLLGYSSGAHLATLLNTDANLLSQSRLSPAIIGGIIALDVPQLDIPSAMAIMETEETGLPQQMQRLANLHKLFGSTRASQEKFSPAAYLRPMLCNTSFLLITTGLYNGHRQSLSRRMAESFICQLRTLNIKAEHHHFENVDHAEIIHRFTELISVYVLPFLEYIGRRPGKNVSAPAGVVVTPTNQIAAEGDVSPRDRITQRDRSKHRVRTPRRAV